MTAPARRRRNLFVTDLASNAPHANPAPAAPRQGWFARGSLGSRGVWLIVALVIGWIAWRYYWTEGRPATQTIAIGATLTLAALLMLASRRLLMPMVLTGGIIAVINSAAYLKLQAMNLVLHAYDLVFYLSDWNTIRFLFSNYAMVTATITLALTLVAILAMIAFRVDSVRISRRLSTALLAGGIVLTAGGIHGMGERRHSQFEYQGQYVSSFVLSWAETLETLAKGQLIDAAAPGPGTARFAAPAACTPAVKPPHVILIHQESVVPPSYFPTLAYDRRLDPFFRSHDGALHRLRVETYGGNSVMTEFSLLTGISTRSFGGMRQFVQTVMADKIGDTLPQALARCGYRPVMYYPMMKNFVNTSRFFAGVGFPEILDMKDQGARTVSERDGFYYGNALDGLERHLAASDKPLFAFIETMATHWPYNITYWPDLDLPGGGPGTSPEMHEYLRRLALAKQDLDTLRIDLARRFPDERFLIVRYGDHHPMATRMLLSYTEGTEAEDVVLHPDSIGFQTFYAVEGVNYAPPPLPDIPVVDVPYLGTILLRSAGLPLSEAYRERERLMQRCGGRYDDCADRDQILAFHRRLIDSDLMQAR